MFNHVQPTQTMAYAVGISLAYQWHSVIPCLNPQALTGRAERLLATHQPAPWILCVERSWNLDEGGICHMVWDPRLGLKYCSLRVGSSTHIHTYIHHSLYLLSRYPSPMLGQCAVVWCTVSGCMVWCISGPWRDLTQTSANKLVRLAPHQGPKNHSANQNGEDMASKK